MSERLDYIRIAPDGIKALGGVYGYVLESGLDEALLELVYLRVSQINRCAFCIDMHTRDLLKRGMPHEKLALVMVWREAGSLFSAREQAALIWTESVTSVSETAIPDDAYHAAIAVFSSKEVVDLTIAISLMNTYNRLGIGFRRRPQALGEMFS